MALTYGFFNSINEDRKYDAAQMSSLFDGIIKDGVFDSIGNIFAVTPGTGMQVLVDSGRAWFNHTWTLNDAQIPLALTAADVTLGRYDAVVLEVNAGQAVRANCIKIVTGTAASTPVKPTMTDTDTLHQHPIAYIYVAGGATSISSSNIEIVVGTSACPFVTGAVQSVNIDALFAQWNGEFDEWFANVQAQLEGNVVTNLQNQINQVKVATGITMTDATKEKLDNSVNVDAALGLIGRLNAGLGNEYVWRKTHRGIKYTAVKGTTKQSKIIVGNDKDVRTFYYADSITISDSGEIVLVNPTTTTVSYSTYSNANILGDKYFYSPDLDSGSVYYGCSTAWQDRDSNMNYVVKINCYEVTVSSKEIDITDAYLNSPDPNSYPPSVSDGYTYTSLGQFGNKTQIAIGSYVGTGVYGSSNKNSLTFDFVPQFLFVSDDSYDGNAMFILQDVTRTLSFGNLRTNYSNSGNIGHQMPVASFDGKTISWYGTNDAQYQLNTTNVNYRYIAIG